MSGPAISVVVPTLGASPELGRCLASLAGQTRRDFETIVVCNGCDGSAVETLGRDVPGLSVLALGENRGFAGAVDAGAAAARGPLLAVVNDDAALDPRWLAAAAACSERHPRAASVATKVLRHDDPSVIDGAGDVMTRSLKAYRRGHGERDAGQFEVEEQVFAASGTACLWRLEAFRRLGGYDESFFAYYEDVDLGFRARRAGYECWYAPEAVATHVGAATSAASWREVESHLSVRNRWATALKNAPPGWFLRNAHRIAAGELSSLGRAAARRELGLVARAYADVARGARAWRRSSTAGAGDDWVRRNVTESLPPARMSVRRLRASAGLTAGRPR